MKQPMRRKIMAFLMSATMISSIVATSLPIIYAADSPPMTGTQARKDNQPKFSGYRVWDIRDWTPAKDPGSEFLRAEIPLQKRIAPFKQTQANPQLDSDAEIMLMQGDYGNTFVDGMMYNNTFNYNTLNFWQYTDYFSPWHGAATSTSPEDLYDWNLENSDPNGWQKRYFEFGVLNIPNPAYTNAAHKNGTKSIACIYFDQSFRQGQTINELFVKDANGKLPVAEKLIEMAEYFGYDGYFFNAEESVFTENVIPKKEFLARLESAGLYTQYYDTNSYMNESKANWLETEINGKKTKLQDSVFVNYGWPSSVDTQMKFMADNNINPFKQAFYGVEANQGKFDGSHPSARDLSNLYKVGTKNLRASVALFTPSDFYQRGEGIDAAMLEDPDYQWMIAERERMYFSGVKSDPTDTGKQPDFARPDVKVNNASGWVGVADFASERSVIDGSTFYTDFNNGKGMQYYNNGKVSRDEQWSNITVQDVLPSWQWWNESTSVNKLKVDFDYGENYFTGATNFEKIGAYNGGSSLVVAGNLDAQNLIKLYKTDLAVRADSKMDITYLKPSKTDGTEMQLAVIFKDAPTKVEYIKIPNTGKKTTSWTTQTIDLGAYAGKEIATIGLAFDAKQGAAADYQMNIGAIKMYSNTDLKPAKPTNFTIDRMFSEDELIVKWDLGDFNKVEKYEIFATLADGTKINVGSNYDSIYYIKSLFNKTKQDVKLELVAIGKDGTKSDPAVINYTYTDKVSDVKVAEVKKEVKTIKDAKVVGSVTQTKDLATVNVSWVNPKTDYKSLKIDVKMDDSADKSVFTKTVSKGTTSAEIYVPRGQGESYQVSISTVSKDGKISAPINVTGKMFDTFSESYNPENIRIDGNVLTLYCPDANDWFKIHATFNGQQLSFTSRFVPNQETAIRATTYMKATLPSTTGTVSVVVEDYSGNFSKPTIISVFADPDAKITEELVPDLDLRNAIIKQAGDTIKKVSEFAGTLNLAGINVSDYTGLSLLGNVKVIDLTNSGLKSINPGMMPASVEKIILKDSKLLTTIDKSAFTGLSALKELDITGCENLTILNLNNSTLEKLTYGDITKLSKLVSVDMSNARFDLSADTSEKQFVDIITAQTAGKDDIVQQSSKKENLAVGQKALETSTLSNASKLFDGSYGYFSVGSTFPKDAIIKFDSQQEIVGFKLTNDTGSYGLADFEVQSSNDGTTWKTVGTAVTGNANEVYEQTVTNPEKAMYYKFIAKKGMGAGGKYICELDLYGYKSVTYPAGVKADAQRPVAYQKAIPEKIDVKVATGTADARTLIGFETVRGTEFKSLKGASFIDATYNIDEQAKISGTVVKLTDKAGNVVVNEFDASKNATYNAEYVSFANGAVAGEIVGTTTLNVGTGSPVEPTPDPKPDPKPDPTPEKPVIVPDDNNTGSTVTVPPTITNVKNPTLTVNKLNKNDTVIKDFIAKAGKSYNVLDVYDINLFSDNVKVTKVEGGKLQITIPFKGVDGTSYVVLRYNDDGTMTELKATYKDGFITFETDHLSKFAVATTRNPQTSDTTPIMPIVLLALISGATLIIGKKFKETQEIN